MGKGAIIKESFTLKVKKCKNKETILKSQDEFAFIKENKTGEQKVLLIMSKMWKSDSCSVRDQDKRQPNTAPNPNIQPGNCWNEEMDGPGIS